MRVVLRRKWPRWTADHEDWIREAVDVWNKKPEVRPETCVERIARSKARREKRRAAIVSGDLEAVRRRAIGGQASSERTVKRFSKQEEAALRDAVLERCEQEYRKSWGKDWEPDKAWSKTWKAAGVRTLREMLRKIDHESPDHVQIETEARKVIDAIRSPVPLGSEPPNVGGSAVVTLWRIRKLIEEYYDTRELSEGHLDESELRRFVARARNNPAFQIALGCVRRPPDEPEGSKPNPRWVTRPIAEELTVIWLLAGGWPGIRWPERGITVTELIHRSMLPTIKAAIKAVGAHPFERETKIGV
jgi:hypothetical protein